MPPSQTRPDEPWSEFFGRIMDDYLERRARGENPRVEDYVALHPRFAAAIRQSLQTLEAVCGVGPPTDPPSRRSALGAGRIIGDFQLLGELGRGGMGVVYEAEQISLQRRVALKVLPFAALANDKALRRFGNEVRAAASLDHPNIVSVYSVGKEQGIHYYAMQLVRGQPLSAWIRELASAAGDETGKPCDSTAPGASGRSGPSNSHTNYFRLVAELGIQAADALQHAHEQGVIHRDVKPGNLLLDESMTLHVADFGLARIETDAGMTTTGDVVGTLRYMSPEQATASQPVDHRTDIYSLGATLYELLTLRPPFTTQAKPELLRRIACDDPPRPRRLNASIPVELETIVLKALEKRPGDRYGSAEELSNDLRAFLEHRPIQAQPPTPLQRVKKWAMRNPAVVAATMLLLIALTAGSGVASLLIWKEKRLASAALVESQRSFRRAELARARESKAKRRAQQQEQLANEAARMARAAEQRANREVIKLLVSTGNHRLDDGDLSGSLPWFAEALRLVTGTPEEAVHRVRLATVLRQCPKPALLVPGRIDADGWSRDGHYLLTRTENRVQLWDVSTGEIARTIRLATPALWASLTPAGDRIVAIDSNGHAQVWRVEGRQPPTAAFELGRGVVYAAFRSQGTQIVTLRQPPEQSQLEMRCWDISTGEALTQPRPRDGGTTKNASFKHASLSSDGRWLVTTSLADSFATVWDVATGKIHLKIPTQHRGGILYSAFAPHRSHFVTTDRNGSVQLWDAVSGSPVTPPMIHSKSNLNAVGTSWVRHASFSRDGRYVATVGHDKMAIVFDCSAGTPLIHPMAHESELLSAAFSPDGRWLATGSDSGEVRLWDLHKQRPVATRLKHGGGIERLLFGPRGRYLLAGTRDTTVLWDLATVDAGHRVLLLPLGATTYPAFVRNGASIITTCDSVQPACVWNPLSGRPAPPLLGNRARDYQLSGDGRVCAVVGDDRTVRVWDLAKGNEQTAPLKHDSLVVSIALDHSGQRAICVCEDGRVILWNLTTGAQQEHESLNRLEVTAATLSADGQRLAIAESNGTVGIYDWDSGEQLCSKLNVGGLSGLKLIGSSHRLITFGGQELCIWDWQAGRLIGRGIRPSTYIRTLALNRSESRCAIGYHDGSVEVWDTRTGHRALSVIHIVGRVDAVSFSPDDRLLLIVGEAAGARLYDVQTGQPVGPAMRPALRGASRRMHLAHGALTSFSPDSRQIAVGGWGEVRLWNMAPDLRPVPDLIRLARLLSASQFDDQGNLVGVGEPQLRNMAADLRRKYPSDFQADQTRILAWHQRLADDRIESRDALPHHDALIALKPDRWTAYRQRARTHRSLKHWKAAIADLRSAVHRAPELGVLHHELSVALLNQEDPSSEAITQAMSEAHRATELIPYYHRAWIQLARCRMLDDDPQAALQAVDQAIRSWQGTYANAEHHLLRADILMALGRTGDAVSDMNAAVRAAPENAVSHFRRSLLLLSLGRVDDYQHCCRTMVGQIDTAPVESLPWIALACALAPDSVPDMWRVAQRLEHRLAELRDPGAMAALGSVLCRAGRYREAVSRLRRAMKEAGDGHNNSLSLTVAPYFLTLAERQLGHARQAQPSLSSLKSNFRVESDGRPSCWEYQALTRLLQREVEHLGKTGATPRKDRVPNRRTDEKHPNQAEHAKG